MPLSMRLQSFRGATVSLDNQNIKHYSEPSIKQIEHRLDHSNRQQKPPRGVLWSHDLDQDLLRENGPILASLTEAEKKLENLKFELSIAAQGRLELVIKLADAEQEIKRLGVKLVSSQNEVQQLASDLDSSNAIASNILLSMEQFPRLFESSSEAFIVLEGAQISHCNEAAARLFGAIDRSQLYGQTLANLSPYEQPGGRQSLALYKEYVATACQTGHRSFDWVIHRQNNHQEVATEIVLTALPFKGTSVFLVSARDATERQQQAQKMEVLAFFDELTGLPNRRLLLDRLAQAMAQSRRSNRHGAVMFLDLDHFKTLNDQFGHACGDEVLRQTAARIQQCVRAEDTVSRQGGDEFVALIVELDEDPELAQRHALAVGEKIRKALEQPYTLQRSSKSSEEHSFLFQCPASLGIALFQATQTNVENILKTVDSAMYRAKLEGGNRIECAQYPLTSN